MKLRNKKTGEIGYTAVLQSKAIVVMDENAIQLGIYTSLAELNEEWEDVLEEPKEFWYIYGDQVLKAESDCYMEDMLKAIGNYFGTQKEAELVVRKLKAWKRLKDKGFFFDGRTSVHDNTVRIRARVGVPFLTDELANDLDLLFCTEENS